MSTKQTRKSISISGELYTALRDEAEARCVSGSGMVEAVMRKYLGLPERPKKLERARVTAKPEAFAARGLPPPKKIGRPVTKLKAQTAPPSEAVEVTSTSVHLAVDPKQQLKLDRAKEFEKWSDKQPKQTEDQKRAASIFTF